MAMKKNISKALALAVMMSVLACGSAYAVNTTYYGENNMQIYDENHMTYFELDAIRFYSKPTSGPLNLESRYYNGGFTLLNPDYSSKTITMSVDSGLKMGGLDIANVKDITATGTIKAGTSGKIKSGETGLVNGGAVYTYLESQNYLTAQDIINKADKATTLAGYGITDGATKTELEGKADKATTLAGYGITDAYTKSETDTELAKKADKATTLAGYGITDGATKTEVNAKADKTALDDEVKAREQGDADTLKKANDYTDQEIAKISGGASSEALEKLDNKINQTNDRVDRVGATAAALAGINYQPMAKGQSQVAVGLGGYKGKKATALGLAYQFNDRVSGSVAGAANGSEHMFNVGFNYLFGQHSDKDIAQCAAVPGSVSLKEAELQSEVDSLKAHIAKQDAEMAELKAMVKALAAK